MSAPKGKEKLNETLFHACPTILGNENIVTKNIYIYIYIYRYIYIYIYFISLCEGRLPHTRAKASCRPQRGLTNSGTRT